MVEDFGRSEGNVVILQKLLEVPHPSFEIENIAIIPNRSALLLIQIFCRSEKKRSTTHLLGISLLVIGSYPTHFTLAFSQLAQDGNL
jgi:hypothetical protein